MMLDNLKEKIRSREDLQKIAADLKNQGKKIVFTNGCFDIIHRGHIEYLTQASDFGNIMVIGLNTDASVRKLKGKDRPVNNEEARALVLAAFQFIDYIVLFHEDTPFELIQLLLPDVLVKGGDYEMENIVGHDIVLKNGGKVVTIPFVKGYSTSSVIDKLSKT